MVGTVAVTTGVARQYLFLSCTLDSVRANVGTAPTGASLIAVVKKNGTTSLATATIAAGTNTVLVSGIGAALVAGDYLTVDVTQVGSTVAGSDLTVQPYVI